MAICKDCVSGSLHEGTPTGRVETIHGLPCYIAEPTSGGEPKGIVVIVPDAFGWEFNNNRILADSLAEKGNFRILLPDFMGGWPASQSLLTLFDVVGDDNAGNISKILAVLQIVPLFGSFAIFNRLSVTLPRVTNFFRDLRASTSLPIGAAGYCWGAKHIVVLGQKPDTASDGKTPLFDSAYIAHPSNLSLPGEIENFKLPLSWAHGTKDFLTNEKQADEMHRLLDARNSSVDSEFVKYQDARHGFAVRAFPGDEKEMKSGKDAEEQALAWFSRQFSKAR